MRKTLYYVALFVLAIAINTSSAVVMQFSDFGDTSSLTLNGAAQSVTTQDGAVLRITPAQGGQSGSFFSTETVNASNFSTFFKFRITEPGGSIFDCNEEAGADGITFVIQSISSDIGGVGGGIGYQGIDTSIGVEFDTWCNGAYNDPSSNHIGIDINGSVSHDPTAELTKIITPDFDNGQVWYAWVDYDGVAVEVRISENSTRPTDPDLTMDEDIPSLLGQDDAYIGFTSATGSDWGNHDILYWEYRDNYNPIVTPPDCEEEYQAGYEAGRRSCIEDPASCGIVADGEEPICSQVITYGQVPNAGCWVMFPTPCDVPEGWAISNTKPDTMCGENAENPPPILTDGNCASFDLFSNIFHIPCLDIGTKFWVDLKLAEDHLTINDFGMAE